MASKNQKKKKKANLKELRPESFRIQDAAGSYHRLLNSENNSIPFNQLKDYINNGENYLRQTRRIEVKAFDDTFVNKMEDGLDAVAKILANPRTFIKEEAELVQAGLAKKISALSVQHFASHSQYVRDVDEYGNVTPEKILTVHAETDTAIYENRFIMTLIKKCLTFIQTRYWYVVEHGETFDSDLLQIHNKTVIDGVTYEVDSRIKVSVPSQDDGNSEKNKNLLDRLTNLRGRCSYYLRSPFMEEMKGAKDVANPIHMTNMLMKHPDYHRAYELWTFLDQYEELGISFEVKEFNQIFSDDYKEELSNYITNSILTIHSNRVNGNNIASIREKKYVPKVIFSLEDETYKDGKFIYDAYPEAKGKKKIPLPPLPEEVRLENEQLKVKIKNQKQAKEKVDELILEDKDQIIYQEAQKRIKAYKKEMKDKQYLLNKVHEQNLEIEELNKKIEELNQKIKTLRRKK